jgi:hypothetical protein
MAQLKKKFSCRYYVIPSGGGRIRLIVGFAFLCVSESPGELAAGFRQQKRF